MREGTGSRPGGPPATPADGGRAGAGRNWLEALRRAVARVLSYREEIDGRIVVVGALVLYFMLVSILRAVWGSDAWRWLGVPSGPSLFFDARNVTAALDCRRLGLDPLVESPCDPWGRPMNYPRVWLALRWLGLSQSHTDVFAVIVILLFFVSLLLLVGRLSLGGGLIVTLAVVSPSVMFAVERTNMDLAVFAMMASSVLLWRSGGDAARILSPILMLVAAVAKIYPVFALPAFMLTRDRRAKLVSLFCLVAFGIYFLISLDDIRGIARIAPQGDDHSFGARILLARLYHLVVPDRWQGGAASKQLLAIIPLVAAGIWLWIWGRRRLRAPRRSSDDPWLLAFYFGSFLFLGTFAIGNNFDYRLVFILLTLPQLFRWVMEEPRDSRSRLAAVSVCSVLTLLWIGALSAPLRRFDELASWITVGLFLGLLAISIPPVPGELRRVLGRAEEDRAPAS
jgi:hypothetical protein